MLKKSLTQNCKVGRTTIITTIGQLAGSLSLKPLKQHLIDVALLRLSKSLYSRSVLFKHTNICSSVFPNPLDHRICRPNSDTSALFSIFYLSYHFELSFDAQRLPSVRNCSLVITLPVCTGTNMEGNFRHKVNYRSVVIFEAWILCSYLKV